MTLFEACRRSNCNKAERRGTMKYESSAVYARLRSFDAPITLENFRIVCGATDNSVVRKVSLKDFTRTDWVPVFLASPLITGDRG